MNKKSVELKSWESEVSPNTHPPQERAHAVRGRLNFDIGGFKIGDFLTPNQKLNAL